MSNGDSNKGGKRAVSRHTTESRATAGRLERSIERLERRKGKEAIAEQLAEIGPRQVLIFVKDWLQPGQPGCGSVPKALPLAVAEEPASVWTLFRHEVEGQPPALPYHPVHRHNAFHEDRVHDWDWREGKLRFYSRVADRPCWILLEYREAP